MGLSCHSLRQASPMKKKQATLRHQFTQNQERSRMYSILQGQQHVPGGKLATCKLLTRAHVYGHQTLSNCSTYIPLPRGHTASPRQLKDCNKCQMNFPEITYRPCGFQVNLTVLGRRVPHISMNILASWGAT